MFYPYPQGNYHAGAFFARSTGDDRTNDTPSKPRDVRERLGGNSCD